MTAREAQEDDSTILIRRAIDYATEKHEGDEYDGGPYVAHPIRVLEVLREAGEPWPVLAAAVLHDVVEDTDATVGEIRTLFGAEVADVVAHLTHRDGEDYEAYLDRVNTHPIAARIKIADIRDNLAHSEPGTWWVDRYTKALARMGEPVE